MPGPGMRGQGRGSRVAKRCEELQLERLLGRHVTAGPGAVADLDGQLRAEVGGDERLLDLLPRLVVGLARAEQVADALGEAQARRAQRVLEEDAGGGRAALGLAHARAPLECRVALPAASASRSEMTRLTASSPTVTP